MRRDADPSLTAEAFLSMAWTVVYRLAVALGGLALLLFCLPLGVSLRSAPVRQARRR